MQAFAISLLDQGHKILCSQAGRFLGKHMAASLMGAIDRHRYAGGGEGGHGIATGEVSTFSHLDQPGTGILEAGFEQVEDKPLILTEWTQSPPNQWKAEIAPLVNRASISDTLPSW